ncbi:hypothetical protein [Altererythrobacter sp. Root672]|uniref:hypothetical protein n=1 Tax=Altererythrobacter sp. Root672 TaxID=1736584 RepID=UPI0006FD8836|nr:hypothetical protein [Altererythrobacter sp. Root672]KRA84079.1 hypothetical protein ASD76_08785 [Altererythrobacter sp. Root672]
MDGKIGWGRPNGRATLEKLVSFIEGHPAQPVFRISMEGVEQIDASFASEAIVELIRRYRGQKGICLVDLLDLEVQFNISVAAARVDVPIAVWRDGVVEIIGGQPSQGNREALEYALTRSQARAAELAETKDYSIANASTKFKQLWEQGFLMRNESAADSGGVEFVYRRIG